MKVCNLALMFVFCVLNVSAEVPNIFADGQPAIAAEVNENFHYLDNKDPTELEYPEGMYEKLGTQVPGENLLYAEIATAAPVRIGTLGVAGGFNYDSAELVDCTNDERALQKAIIKQLNVINKLFRIKGECLNTLSWLAFPGSHLGIYGVDETAKIIVKSNPDLPEDNTNYLPIVAGISALNSIDLRNLTIEKKSGDARAAIFGMEKSLVVVENVKTVGFIMGLVMRAGKVFIKNFTAEEGGIAINYGSHAFLNGTNNAVFMTVDSGKVTQQESGTTTINSLDIKNGSDWVVVTKGENILKNTSLKISSSVVTLDSYEQQGGEANVNTGSALTVNELTLGQSTLNINSGSQINVVSSFKATDASLLVSQNSHASLNSGDGTTGTSLDVAMNASVNIVNVPLSAVEATTGSVLDIEGDGSVDMSAMTGVCSRGGRIYTSGVTLASLTDCP